MTRDAIFIEDGFDLGAVIYFLWLARQVIGGDSREAKSKK
jgi:hypothetical protein